MMGEWKLGAYRTCIGKEVKLSIKDYAGIIIQPSLVILAFRYSIM